MAVIDIGIRQVSILCIVYHVVGAVGIVVAMVYAVAIYFAECILGAQLVLSSFTVWIIADGILSDGHIVKAFNHSVDDSPAHASAVRYGCIRAGRGTASMQIFMAGDIFTGLDIHSLY